MEIKAVYVNHAIAKKEQIKEDVTRSVEDKEKKGKMRGWMEGKRHGQRRARVGGQEEKENEVKINE